MSSETVQMIMTLLGGLAVFIYGMNLMSDGLQKAAGDKMRNILALLTSNPVFGVLAGALITAVLQSSSATTVMVIGFTSAGLMKLRQAISVIMGANIGTTVTSWILSLTGIESSSFWVQLLKPTSFSPILAVIGAAFVMFSKNEKRRDVGSVLIGFAILMEVTPSVSWY